MVRSSLLAASLTMALSSGALAQAAAGAAPPSAQAADLTNIRAALDKYRDPIVAVRDGYFSTVACIDFPHPGGMGEMAYPAGGMGVHFLNMANVGPQLDTLRPQVLIYEPRNGRLVLAAAEWFVPTQVSPQRPTLFGRQMDGPMEGHVPIQPAELHHWDLHVWLWKHNPAGTFSPTNPSVRCPNGAPYTFHDAAPHMVGQH